MQLDLFTILRDGVWQAIGVAVAIAATYLAWLTYAQQRSVKDLTAGVLRTRVLLSVPDSIQQRLALTFDNMVVQAVHLVDVGFKNSGNLPILPTDFVRRLTVEFGSGCSILSASVAKQSPEGLAPDLAWNGASLSVDPLLLNPGDFAVAQVLLSGKPSHIKIDARIAGITKVSSIYTPSPVNPVLRFFVFSIVAISVSILTNLASNYFNGTLIAEQFSSPPMKATLLFITILLVVAPTTLWWMVIGWPTQNTARRAIDDA